MIYKIYGLYDGSSLRYIGCTYRELTDRLTQHLSTANKKGPQCHRVCWLKSMQTRDKKVTIKLLASYNTSEEMYRMEVEWIAQSRLEGADLVNTCTGGKGSNGHKWRAEDYEKRNLKIKQYSIEGELIAIYNSISDAAEVITGDRKNNNKLTQVCKGKRGRRIAFGYIWRYIDDVFTTHPTTGQWNVTQAQRIAISKRQTENNVMKGRTGKLNFNSSPINQVNDKGEIINSFDSIVEATKQTGITGISAAAQRNYRAGGFYWQRQTAIKRRYSPILTEM
jgi:hypothetical protein